MKEIDKLPFALFILLASVSCSPQKPDISTTQQPAPTQVAVVDIKRRWEEQVRLLDRAKLRKDYPGRKLDILVSLLEEVPAFQIDEEVERVRKLPNAFEDMQEYDKYLLESLFLLYGKRDDRDKLVYLLAAKCPRFIATSAIELEVASLRVRDPFLVLLDSYDKAADPGARRYLLEIVRDSLKDISQQYPDDAEFARTARAWYVDNQTRIETNPYYHPFASFPEQRDLFVARR